MPCAQWSDALGQPTFVGSSGRVFPQAFKASPLLRAWLRRLDAAGVQFALRHRWTGWDEDGILLFPRRTDERPSSAARPCWRSAAQAGRGSGRTAHGWRRSRQRAWRYRRFDRPIAASPSPGRRSSATASKASRSRARRCRSARIRVRGEAMMTRTGIEGGAVYALSADLREAVDRRRAGNASRRLAARSRTSDLVGRLSMPRGKQSVSNWLRKAAHLSPVAIGLLQEAAMASACVAGVAIAGESCRTDQRRAGQARWHGADRAGDLDRRRYCPSMNSTPTS